MADFARESMMEMFTYEMSQLLEQLEQNIIQDEEKSEYTDDTVNEIFRIMHTIKGSAAMMMFTTIQDVGHAIEDLFYYIREKRPKQVDYSELTDIVLEGKDFVKNELDKIENNLEANGKTDKILAHVKEFLAILKGDKTPIEQTEENGQSERNTSKHKAHKSLYFLKATIKFEAGCEMENIRAYTIVHNLEGAMNELYHVPEDIIDEDSAEEIRKDGFKMYMGTDALPQEIESILEETVFLSEMTLEAVEEQIIDNMRNYGKEILTETSSAVTESEKAFEQIPEMHEEIVAAPVQAQEAEEKPEVEVLPKDAQPKKAVGQQMISVNISKLDALQNLTGELVMSEAMVTQSPELFGLELDGFRKAARQLHKIINDVQDTVMSMRLVSLSTTFSKMHRIVRDMCKQLGKDVALEIEGAETEVDRNIIEHISDPLMHIIRNAIDHGIETPEERRAVGKPLKGTITLEAKNTGGDVLIIIRDDGQGIDKDSVLKKAKNNELLRKNPTDYTEKEIYQFIMMPGFSTNKEVTQYSGRGVGMDVVQTNIDAVGGSVLIDSLPGEGSIFTLKIPLTLAIIDGMIIKLGQAKYTVPITAIKESFEATSDNIFTDPDGNEMIMVRNEAYNVMRLGEFYNIKTDAQNIEDGILIMLENEEQTVCVLADQLIGEQQVVVKSMPKYIKKIRGLSGCTLLGNGEISLIADVAGFFNN